MKNNIYTAKEGMIYKRIIDGFIMGNKLYLNKFIDGTDDVITNYIEVEDIYSKPKTTARHDNAHKS
jgi:hypothetical protein